MRAYRIWKCEKEAANNRNWKTNDGTNLMHLELRLKNKEELINIYKTLSVLADVQVLIKNDVIDLTFRAARLHDVRLAIDAR